MKNLLLIVLLGALCGCQQQPKTVPASLELTFNRGAQLLAAGSPKSAIPFLSQTIAAEPDGPEPIALLALAFALDLQGDQAIVEAQKVHRPAGEPAGWEAVATGIAATVRHCPAEAIGSFQHVLATARPGSPLLPAARQWLALAQVIQGDHPAALATLDELAKSPGMKASAQLWSLLILARDGQNIQAAGPVVFSSNSLVIQAGNSPTQQAADILTQCAHEVAGAFGNQVYKGTLDDQTLYDSGIAAIADGKLENAHRIFTQLQKRDSDGGDATLWLALIAAAQGRWQAAHNALADACDTGPIPSRGLANHLCTVLRALEDRPESMIQHMLAGQRMMGHEISPAHIIDYPKPESVWFSDALK